MTPDNAIASYCTPYPRLTYDLALLLPKCVSLSYFSNNAIASYCTPYPRLTYDLALPFPECVSLLAPDNAIALHNKAMLKQYKHNPPHLFMDNTYYFITSSTLYKKKLFATEKSRLDLSNTIKDILISYDYKLIGWVVLSNHYHLLCKSKIGEFIPGILRKIHSKSAIRINKSTNTSGKVWFNYWDKCIRNEESLYRHLNYIHLNPVKHGFVTQPQEYGFSSYNEYLTAKGEDWLLNMFTKYPVIDFMKNDDF